jgi:hypothetical protein
MVLLSSALSLSLAFPRSFTACRSPLVPVALDGAFLAAFFLVVAFFAAFLVMVLLVS